MTPKSCCFTSANLAYLSRARVLAATFKEYNPNVDMVLILVDEIPESFIFDMDKEPFDRIIEVKEIGIPDFLNWSFKHNVVELCTAIKASAAKFLVMQYESVIYLDPDIAVFNSLSFILNLLTHSDILLTPHQLTPNIDNDLMIQEHELSSQRHGIFNLGFFAVSNKQQAILFLDWWEARLMKYCYEDIPSGIFTDQKWCNLANIFFDNVYIIKDFGCNVASWNLYERLPEYDNNNQILINQKDTLKFYHFTKYGSAGDAMTSRYAKNSLVLEIWYWYGRKLKQYDFSPPPKGYYKYGFYTNGESISEESRLAFRKTYKLGQENPYDALNDKLEHDAK